MWIEPFSSETGDTPPDVLGELTIKLLEPAT
jgi:hypothetical protein